MAEGTGIGRSLTSLKVIKKCRLSTFASFFPRKFHTQPACLGSIDILMPSLSPTMTEGTIVKWYKKEGDPVAAGDLLCDIQTDKAVVSMDTEEEGIMAKILMPENSKDVKIGTLIAVMVEEGDDWKNVEVSADKIEAGAGTSSPPAAATEAPPAAAPASSTSPTSAATLPAGTVRIEMPSLSPTMTEGTIVKWLKKEGDPVAAGDVLCDIQTDKAVVSMDTEEEGVLAKILKPEGSSEVQIGTLIAVIAEEGVDWKSLDIPDDIETAPVAAAPSAPPPPSTPSTTPAAPTPAPTVADHASLEAEFEGVSMGPSVRKLLLEHGLSPKSVSPSGPHGRLLKGDVLKYIESKNLSRQDLTAVPSPAPGKAPVTPAKPLPTPGESYVDIPLSNMRKTIAKRLTESKSTIPHSYATISSNVGAIGKMRQQLAEEGVKVSVNDFIIKATALALQRIPQINSVWEGDSFRLVPTQDISVAVATESGLITPIVKNASQLGVDDISATVKDLAERARAGKLKLDEFQGGTFSISNLGMYGISEFTAVINPPQTAILAVGGTQLLPSEDGRPQQQMKVTLSYDARVVDEAQATEFLEVFREIIENPKFIVAGSRVNATLRAAQ